jgi:hypothetical protein
MPSSTPEIKTRKCGLTCSYDSPAPAVPNEYRGAIYRRKDDDEPTTKKARQRNELCRKNKICESCRRPESAHAPGQTFRPVGEFDRNK